MQDFSFNNIEQVNKNNAEEYINYFIEKYSNMVYKLALCHMKNKTDAEDIFQEVFLRLIKKMPTFDSAEHEKAWLIRVTINCCKKLHTSAWNRRTITLTEDIAVSSVEGYDILFSVLQLPIKFRRVIHLFYYENMSIDQISRVLSLKEGTVKSQLSRARKMLKSKLEGDV